MPYLSRDSQDPDGQETPADSPATTGAQTKGSPGWAIALTVVGWVVLAPGALVIGAFAMLAVSVSPDAGGGLDPADALKAILVAASALCAPVILGISLYRKSAGLAVIGALSLIPALYGLFSIGSGMF